MCTKDHQSLWHVNHVIWQRQVYYRKNMTCMYYVHNILHIYIYIQTLRHVRQQHDCFSWNLSTFEGIHTTKNPANKWTFSVVIYLWLSGLVNNHQLVNLYLLLFFLGSQPQIYANQNPPNRSGVMDVMSALVRQGAHVIRGALMHLMYQLDQGVCCPITMTFVTWKWFLRFKSGEQKWGGWGDFMMIARWQVVFWR